MDISWFGKSSILLRVRTDGTTLLADPHKNVKNQDKAVRDLYKKYQRLQLETLRKITPGFVKHILRKIFY